MEKRFDILIPLDGREQWFTLCSCDDIRSCMDVVRILLEAPKNPPQAIKVEVREL